MRRRSACGGRLAQLRGWRQRWCSRGSGTAWVRLGGLRDARSLFGCTAAPIHQFFCKLHLNHTRCSPCISHTATYPIIWCGGVWCNPMCSYFHIQPMILWHAWRTGPAYVAVLGSVLQVACLAGGALPLLWTAIPAAIEGIDPEGELLEFRAARLLCPGVFCL